MKHARQKIREGVAAILAAIPVTIYTSRVYPLVSLPVISIYAREERAESENNLIGAPRRYSRKMRLEIEVTVSAVTGFDDSADDYAARIESLMAADVTLTGLATDSVLSQTSIEVDGSSEKPIAVTRLEYEVWYRTIGTDSENAI